MLIVPVSNAPDSILTCTLLSSCDKDLPPAACHVVAGKLETELLNTPDATQVKESDLCKLSVIAPEKREPLSVLLITKLLVLLRDSTLVPRDLEHELRYPLVSIPPASPINMAAAAAVLVLTLLKETTI